MIGVRAGEKEDEGSFVGQEDLWELQGDPAQGRHPGDLQPEPAPQAAAEV